MAWSTRELAELAGTTVNAVRHYHRTGLLEEPERQGNGYKQYGVQHLVTLLRIRRLVDLGMPLAQVGDVEAATDPVPEALRDLDAELGASIERLTRARAEIAAILRERSPAHTPAGFASVASRLSEADSSMIHIYTQLYDEEALADVREMAAADTENLGGDIDRLPADADEATRQRLTERLAATLARSFRDHPWLADPAAHLSRSSLVTAETFVEAVTGLYNRAQLDVLVRANTLARQQTETQEGPDHD